MVAAQMLAMGELMILRKKLARTLKKWLCSARRRCPVLDAGCKAAALAGWEPRARVSLHLQSKDLNIVMETAREYGISLPGAGCWLSFTRRCAPMAWRPG
jgi:2-hydroxy-3-oxopropionate reductase